MPSLKRPSQPHRLGQGDTEDHQGDADGRRGEAAPCPGGSGSGAPLFRAHGRGAGQHRPAIGGGGDAPGAARRHRQGQGASAGRLHRRARPVRRLQFVRSRVLPANMPAGCWPTARRSRSSASARRAMTSCAAITRRCIVDRDRSARGQDSSASTMPMRSPRRSSTLFEEGEFDVCTLFFSQFKSVISQMPTALQLIPAGVASAPAAAADRRQRRLRIRAGGGDDPRRPSPAQHLGAGFPGAAGKCRLRNGRAR